MRQPDDEGQQIIERIVERNGNGLFSKFQNAILIAAALAVGTGLWSINTRLTRVETMLDVLTRQVQK